MVNIMNTTRNSSKLKLIINFNYYFHKYLK